MQLIEKKDKEDDNLEIKEFLENIDIQLPKPYEIIENHILPDYENGIWKEKNDTVLLGYVRYIKDNLGEYELESYKQLNANMSYGREDPLEELRKSILLKIKKSESKEEKYECPKDIYLPKIYGNRNDLEILFKGIEVNFLHPCYIQDILGEYKERSKGLRSKLKGKSKRWKKRHKSEAGKIDQRIKKMIERKDEEIEEWKKFFLKLGVGVIPRVIYKTDKICDPYPDRHQNYGYVGTKLQYISYVEDWILEFSKAFEEITDYALELDVQNLNEKQRILFLHILDKNWDFYKHYFSKEVVYKQKYLRSSRRWDPSSI